MNADVLAQLSVSIAMPTFAQALEHATEALERFSKTWGWRKWHTDHELYLRRANRAAARSRRNQPGPVAQRLPFYSTGGSTNRNRNKHGRKGCAR